LWERGRVKKMDPKHTKRGGKMAKSKRGKGLVNEGRA